MGGTTQGHDPYDRSFFDSQRALSATSADAMVPRVVALLRPTSVVDVGCGVGTWLAAFKQHGVRDVHGYDGDYVRASGLQVDDAEFSATDLTAALHAGRSYDLAVSLEVGEHLPARAAPVYVQSLVDLAPVVLFSAAFPGQGGTDHVNEQWPPYWHALFAAHDYAVLDPIRPHIWQDERIAWWYRCNTFLYVRRDVLRGNATLEALQRDFASNPLTLTHKKVVRLLAGSGRLAKYRTRIAMRLLG